MPSHTLPTLFPGSFFSPHPPPLPPLPPSRSKCQGEERPKERGWHPSSSWQLQSKIVMYRKYPLLTEFEVRTVTYSTDREDEVSKILYLLSVWRVRERFPFMRNGFKFLNQIESKTSQFEIVLKAGYTWRLFWRRLTPPFCQYLGHVSSDAKSLRSSPLFGGFV